MGRRVIIESPFAGATILEEKRNVLYAQRCLSDSLWRGEQAFASHLLYPQVLNDRDPFQRKMGIRGQLEWMAVADAVIVYQDLGVSSGMQAGIDEARRLQLDIEYRYLDK